MSIRYIRSLVMLLFHHDWSSKQSHHGRPFLTVQHRALCYNKIRWMKFKRHTYLLTTVQYAGGKKEHNNCQEVPVVKNSPVIKIIQSFYVLCNLSKIREFPEVNSKARASCECQMWQQIALWCLVKQMFGLWAQCPSRHKTVCHCASMSFEHARNLHDFMVVTHKCLVFSMVKLIYYFYSNQVLEPLGRLMFEALDSSLLAVLCAKCWHNLVFSLLKLAN